MVTSFAENTCGEQHEMSDLFNAADAEQSPAATMETMAELERRHKSEVRKLEGEVRALVKTAKKSTKAQIETQIIRMQYELKERHQDEYDALESAAGSVVDGGDQKAALQENATDQNSDDEPDLKTDEDIAAAKKAKAKKKQDKKKTKEQTKLQEKQAIQAENSGPSMREIELEKLNSKLSPESLQVKTIISDGNCLYRAISDQLAFIKAAKIESFPELRTIAAEYMRSNAADFCPFLGLDTNDPEFEVYCAKVASATDAEWGGQPEIMALAVALQRPIHIYAADAPVVRMGEESGAVHADAPLRITYHKHYYALGEHYNSVTSCIDSGLAELNI